jgi:beta-lactamase class A
MKHKQKIQYAAVGALLFFTGVALGWYLHVPPPAPSFSLVREAASDYKFIDPVLYTQISENAAFPQYLPLKDTLTQLASTTVSSSKATDVSVYFQDLNSSHWIGVNTGNRFSPASMLKVVTLISAYHTAESFPPLMSGTITISNSQYQAVDSQDFYPPTNPVTPGNSYSIQDLLARLIIESDNNANTVLTKYLGDTTVNQTFDDLHLPRPMTDSSDVDTAQEYSHLFRVLYNASYLSSSDSEKALELLSNTTFTQGLVAGVPPEVVVSHKFGERTITTSNSAAPSTRELHDCGIIYYPSHPYFLCVMTRGTDFPTLAGVIQNISHVVWGNIDAQYSK